MLQIVIFSATILIAMLTAVALFTQSASVLELFKNILLVGDKKPTNLITQLQVILGITIVVALLCNNYGLFNTTGISNYVLDARLYVASGFIVAVLISYTRTTLWLRFNAVSSDHTGS